MVIGVRGGRYAPPVDIAKLPPYVPAAFVAIEDKRFYEHQGFDLVGIARAVATDLGEGHAAQGASTITQQLARNLFLTSDPHPGAQGRGADLRGGAGAGLLQAADPRALPLQGLFRRRRLRHRGRQPRATSTSRPPS